MSSPYSYSDSILLEKILEIANENASNSTWPAHLKAEAIRAEAEKTYSLWNRIITALGNYSHVQNRDGHFETQHTQILGPGGSINTRSQTYYVQDRFNNAPGPYKTNHREFLDKTYSEVSRLNRNYKHNSLGYSPDKFNELRTSIQTRAKEQRCCGLGFYYYRYIVQILKKLSW
jgi:hypothetical protein